MESQLDHGDSASESRTRKEGPEGGRNVVGLEGWGEKLPRESGQPQAELALGSGSLCGGHHGRVRRRRELALLSPSGASSGGAGLGD